LGPSCDAELGEGREVNGGSLSGACIVVIRPPFPDSTDHRLQDRHVP
jgi:hypothetical protein